VLEFRGIFGSGPATIQTAPYLLTKEQNENYVLCSFRTEGHVMVRAVTEEALALASLTLFLAMVAVWAEVLGVL
jgi:hypothetical protein